jgi:hypothetical protein
MQLVFLISFAHLNTLEIYLPQHFALEALHAYAPNSTFILNLRPAADWVASVSVSGFF